MLTPSPNECGSEGVWSVKSQTGFISPPSVGQAANDGRPWTTEAPCLLEFRLGAGQHLNVTLLDFSSRAGDVTSHVAMHAGTVQSSSLSDARRVSFPCLSNYAILHSLIFWTSYTGALGNGSLPVRCRGKAPIKEGLGDDPSPEGGGLC